MDFVTIKKNGFFSETYDKYTESHLIKDDFVEFLNTECKINSDVTLRDIMINVLFNKELKSFIEDYVRCFDLNIYRKILSVPIKKDEDIDFLEIAKDILIWQEKDNSFIEVSNVFYGIGRPTEDLIKEGHDKDSPVTYGMGGNIAEVLDIPIVLKNIKVFIEGKEIEVKEELYEKYEAKGNITFLDVLYSIFNEITFYGPPVKAKEMFEDLNKRVEECESGEVETIPFEDMMLEFEENSKNREILRKFVNNDELDSSSFESNIKYIEEKTGKKFKENMEDFKKDWIRYEMEKIFDEVISGKISSDFVYKAKELKKTLIKKDFLN